MISVRLRAERSTAPGPVLSVPLWGWPSVLSLWLLMTLTATASAMPADAPSRVLDRELRSNSFANTKVGTSPVRKMAVYLPPGYDRSAARYPVIYFLAAPFDSYRSLFEPQQNAQALFDRAIASGVIGPFILVSVDMNTPLGSSWYVNSPVTGNWEDFFVKELVPDIDAQFRTRPNRDARGLAGHFMGGHGALRLGMRHADLFGSIYALQPVGTGTGVQTMYSRPDWARLAAVRSNADLKDDLFGTIFTTIFQAHLPNPDKPPLFIDLAARKAGDRFVVDSALTERLHESFLLERMVPRYADNLKSLRGLKFDWPRSDTTFDHVYSNQAFTHKLDEYGIPHEAEEYNGLWGDRLWAPGGRVQTDLLPFFGKHLVFDADSASPR